jgi:hypothetical protein
MYHVVVSTDHKVNIKPLSASIAGGEMKDTRKYYEALGSAIKNSNLQAVEHYLRQIKKAKWDPIFNFIKNETLNNGITIFGLALNNYLQTKDKAILRLIMDCISPLSWLKICNSEGQYPLDLAIANNDLELYQMIERQTDGYEEHDPFEELTETCGHRSRLEHLMLDTVHLDTYSELIEKAVEEYEDECYSTDNGSENVDTPLLCSLLRTSKEGNAQEISALRNEKFKQFLDVHSSSDYDKMELLLFPWKFSFSKPDQDPLAAAIILGEEEIVEAILNYKLTRYAENGEYNIPLKKERNLLAMLT